jgi:yersiniabactin synthetase, thiazolinyl reductase component
MNDTKRVLVVGAKFGELYLNSFLTAQPGLELAGLMANGSSRARQLARAFGIPLYTSLDQVPGGFDIACVVVRSTIVGGSGSKLAEALLRKGLHVIQEHPLHPTELEQLQALASSLGLKYWVNSFYATASAGYCWLSAAKYIASELKELASFAQLSSSRQLLYSSLDLLLQALHHESGEVEIACLNKSGPFDQISFSWGGTSISLELQNHIDPSDPDQHSLVTHQCQVGWSAGNLSLAGSYGPVLWAPTFFDGQHNTSCESIFARVSHQNALCFDLPTVTTLHEAPKNWRAVLECEAPTAVSRVLCLFLIHIHGHEAPPGLRADHQLTVARLWQQVLRQVGPAKESTLRPPRSINARQLAEVGDWVCPS